MDRSTGIALTLGLLCAGCGAGTPPQSDAATKPVSMASEYRRPDAPAALEGPADRAPILPEIASEQPAAPKPELKSEPEPKLETTVAAATKVEAPLVAPKAGTLPPANIPDTPLEPREMELLIPTRDFQKEGGALRVSFDDIDLLKVLNAEPVPVDVVDHFPGWLKELDGKEIRLRGWMFPPPIESGLPAFLFVRDNQICCFGRKPKVYDKLGVKMKEGSTASYIQGRPFDVIGRLVFKPRVINGELDFLYLIEDATIVDKG